MIRSRVHLGCFVYCFVFYRSVFGAPISDSESKLASSGSKSSSLVPFSNIFCVERTFFVLGEHEKSLFPMKGGNRIAIGFRITIQKS